MLQVNPAELPLLYSFRRCPYAIRARLALKASGVKVELREIVLRAKRPELLIISPKGTVPVLQLPGGRVIDQSLDIMRWALSQHDPLGWLTSPPGAEGARSAQAWIDCNDGTFKALLDRYKYPERYPEHGAHEYREQAMVLMLKPMDSALQMRRQLLSDQASLADMALLPFIRQFAQVDDAWFEQAPMPGLKRWLREHLASPLFESVMGKVEAWQPSSDPQVF